MQIHLPFVVNAMLNVTSFTETLWNDGSLGRFFFIWKIALYGNALQNWEIVILRPILPKE